MRVSLENPWIEAWRVAFRFAIRVRGGLACRSGLARDWARSIAGKPATEHLWNLPPRFLVDCAVPYGAVFVPQPRNLAADGGKVTPSPLVGEGWGEGAKKNARSAAKPVLSLRGRFFPPSPPPLPPQGGGAWRLRHSATAPPCRKNPTKAGAFSHPANQPDADISYPDKSPL